MKFKRKHLLSLVAVCVIGIAIYSNTEYHRKPTDLHAVNPMAITDAESLVALYTDNEEKANAIYLGKPIDVTGIISQIDNQQDTLVNIILGKPDNLHRVSCLLNTEPSGIPKALKTGSKVTIRGICTGFLMDVELNRCVLVEEK
ncbi:MAG: hypothetical protein WKF89_06425 [Chitinophagaceae bacterium]